MSPTRTSKAKSRRGPRSRPNWTPSRNGAVRPDRRRYEPARASKRDRTDSGPRGAPPEARRRSPQAGRCTRRGTRDHARGGQGGTSDAHCHDDRARPARRAARAPGTAFLHGRVVRGPARRLRGLGKPRVRSAASKPEDRQPRARGLSVIASAGSAEAGDGTADRRAGAARFVGAARWIRHRAADCGTRPGLGDAVSGEPAGIDLRRPHVAAKIAEIFADHVRRRLRKKQTALSEEPPTHSPERKARRVRSKRASTSPSTAPRAHWWICPRPARRCCRRARFAPTIPYS